MPKSTFPYISNAILCFSRHPDFTKVQLFRVQRTQNYRFAAKLQLEVLKTGQWEFVESKSSIKGLEGLLKFQMRHTRELPSRIPKNFLTPDRPLVK
jgi:hypothetical protein